MKIKQVLESEALENFVISFFSYTIVLLVFSAISIGKTLNNNQPIVIISSYVEQDIIEEASIDIVDINTFSEELTVLKPNTESLSSSSTIDQEQITISQPQIEIPTDTLSSSISFDSLQENIVGLSSVMSDQQSVGGVLDRLTPEIINHSLKRDLNVIWLFDSSVSLSSQRKDIRNRLQKVLDEIKLSNTSHTVNHTICSFGERLNILSENPSSEPELLLSYMDQIGIDDSGIENVFTSVNELCLLFKNTYNIIIIFTDEVGDDINNLEKSVGTARRNNTSVYVVGPPSPFGSSKIQFKYIDPDPKFDQSERWVEINQGPETLFKLTLDLKTLPIDNEGLDSGYGSYALTRLCQNTGGIYFALHPNRSKQVVKKKDIAPLSSNINVFFDHNIMKEYPPDYRNYNIQLSEIQTNKIKSALVKACQIPLSIIFDQKTEFTAFSEGDFSKQLTEAQNFSAKLEPKIDQIYNLLKSVESIAKNLDDKRWLVSYNLAMGRILATKCRVELYNNMLAEAKAGLKKQDTKSNSWTLEYDDNFESKNSQLSKTFSGAKQYLNNIVDNYPSTPWAAIAQEELNTPMGYKWVEKYVAPPEDKMGNGGNNNNLPKDDVKKKLEYKPQRKTDKI
jgi:hypothetical protein